MYIYSINLMLFNICSLKTYTVLYLVQISILLSLLRIIDRRQSMYSSPTVLNFSGELVSAKVGGNFTAGVTAPPHIRFTLWPSEQYRARSAIPTRNFAPRLSSLSSYLSSATANGNAAGRTRRDGCSRPLN